MVPRAGRLPTAILLLAGLTVFPSYSQGRRVRLGGVSVSAGYVRGPMWWGPAMWGPVGYGPWFGPGLWRPWGPAWFDPFWYGGWAHPGFWTGFAQAPGMGEVKLDSQDRDAMVYLDGAYAGPVRKLRSMWLEPGKYKLEVRDEDGNSFEKAIYVLSGKTMNLKPELLKAGKEK